jgi:methionyl-tRNA synthetase
VADLDDPSRRYPIITGRAGRDYGVGPKWGREPIAAGQPVGPPSPVFTKLDDSIVEEELERLSGYNASDQEDG